MTDYLGLSISIIGFLIQRKADNELHSFRQNVKRDRRKLLKTGLWGFCRHPNYCGELGIWLGLAIGMETDWDYC